MFALVLLLLALVTLVLIVRARRKRRPGEPPLVLGWIPFLGKALDFRTDSYRFLEDLRRKHGDVFTVLIAGRYMTFILNPLHFPSVTKLGRQLNFHEFTDRVAPFAFGYPPLGSGHFPGLHQQVQSSFFLLQGPSLTPLSQSMMRNLMVVFREDYLSQTGTEWSHGQLYDFCTRVVFEATFMTIYGRPAMEQRHCGMDAMRQDFNCFDQVFPMLIAQVPLWLLGQTKAIRQKLIQRFLPSSMSQWTEPSQFIHRRSQVFDQYESLSSDDKAAHHFAILWASVGNTGPGLFWCVYYLLRHQEALQAVKREIQEVMSQDGLEFNPDKDLFLSREQVDRLLCLGSAISESLRLSTMSMNVRVAQEDFVLRLDSQPPWSVRKGDIIAMFPQSVHLDPEIYEDPKSFRFDRYLEDGQEKTDFYKNGQKLKYYLMPFGSGATMCPGRYIAINEIKQFVCLLLLYFDVELEDERDTVRPDYARAGLGIMQPLDEVRFRYRLRRPLTSAF